MLGGLEVGGRIDRVDLRAAGDFARVIDWKTGDPPPEGVGLLGGLELQRVVYAAAVRRALPAVGSVRAVIVHLGADITLEGLQGEALERYGSALEEGLAVAVRRLREGWTVPGLPARAEHFDPIRLALPADLEGWLSRKAAALNATWAPLRPLWDHP